MCLSDIFRKIVLRYEYNPFFLLFFYSIFILPTTVHVSVAKTSSFSLELLIVLKSYPIPKSWTFFSCYGQFKYYNIVFLHKKLSVNKEYINSINLISTDTINKWINNLLFTLEVNQQFIVVKIPFKPLGSVYVHQEMYLFIYLIKITVKTFIFWNCIRI